MTDDLNREEVVETPVVPEVEPDDDMRKPVYSKIQMGDVVNREKQKAFERGKREAMEQLQQQAPQEAAPQQMGGMQQMHPDEIRKMIAEHMSSEVPKLLQEQAAQHQVAQTAGAFINKMQAAEAKHPGLSQQLNDLDFNSIAPLIQLANEMDNTADIMKELLDNPGKIGSMIALSYSQPGLAKKEMAKLSASIKQNETAIASEQQTRDPLSQHKSSTKAAADNNALSVDDLRRMLGAKR